MKRTIRSRVRIAIAVLFCIGIAAVFGVNGYVSAVGKSRLIGPADAAALQDVDCIIVLGCKVKANGELSDMLRDRLQRGVELYRDGAAPKLLMSGDHGQVEYDEVNAMKTYAVENGVPSEDVFMDHAGFSTYETVYRAKEVFGAEKVLIVTQEYHTYRALYIAEQLGVEAYGVASDYHTYGGQTMRECREILARCKDFVSSIFKPEPTYLGESIPVSGNGDVTNDK